MSQKRKMWAQKGLKTKLFKHLVVCLNLKVKYTNCCSERSVRGGSEINSSEQTSAQVQGEVVKDKFGVPR